MAGSLFPIMSWVKWRVGCYQDMPPAVCLCAGVAGVRVCVCVCEAHRGHGVSLLPGDGSQGALQVLVLSLPLCRQATGIKSPLVKLADDTRTGRWQNLGRGARLAAGDEPSHHKAGHNRRPKAALVPHWPGAAQHLQVSCCHPAQGEVRGQAGGRPQGCLGKSRSPWRAGAGRGDGNQRLLNLEPTRGGDTAGTGPKLQAPILASCSSC